MAPPATYTLTSPPTPALTPPSGVIPDFEQPYTLLPYTIVTISEAIIVTTILVLARIYVKVFVVKKLLLEDYTCILGWLGYLVFVSLELHSARYYGAGTHMWNLSQETVSRNQHLANIADMHVCIAYGCIKVSLFLLISRIFLGVKRNILFWINQIFLWANAIYYTIALFINIFACRPRRKIWNADLPGKCFNTKMLYESAASFNTIGDVVLLVVPVIMVWQLRMSTKRKLGISAIFAFGVFATVCAATRVYFQMRLLHSDDYSFIHGQTGLLGYGEVACGIICCCLPLIPLFWRHVAHSPTSLEHPELQNGNGVYKEKLEHEIPRDEKRDEEALHEAISGISPKK